MKESKRRLRISRGGGTNVVWGQIGTQHAFFLTPRASKISDFSHIPVLVALTMKACALDTHGGPHKNTKVQQE